MPGRLIRDPNPQCDLSTHFFMLSSNKEIGAELFISEGTVKAHVKSIFSKLDVVSRTEAVATATRRGLIQL